MQTTEDEETEVQITAAVVDLTKDSDIEEVVARDEEDYSSYESDRESGEKDFILDSKPSSPKRKLKAVVAAVVVVVVVAFTLFQNSRISLHSLCLFTSLFVFL